MDGQVYAEPLVLTNVTIDAGPNTVGTPGTYNSVVFVATQNDSLYAINAANGAILWQRTFLDTTNPNDYLPGATSVTTIPSADTDSDDIYPQVGITSTPVIDPSTNIIYVLPNTEEIVGGNAYYVQRLHAINIADGTDAAPSFVIGTTTNGNTNNTPVYVNGTGDGNVNGVVQFNALRENNRPALSLVNGEVYAEWASHGDNGPYHGWVVVWNVSNLSTQGMVLAGVLCTDPNGGEGGIWGGGGGLTFDPDEAFNGEPAFYFETGNGDPRGGPPPLNAEGFPADDDYYESLVKVEADPTTTATNQNSNGWGLQIVDYFTPYNVNALDDADEDFGSGSPLVLPDSAGIPGHPHLIVAAGKEGTIYLLDRDNLGKFNVNDDDVLNSVYNPSTGITTPPVLINGSLSTPAYYDGVLYWVAGYDSNAWSYVVAPNPAPDPPTVPVATIEPTSETANSDFGYLPGSVMISADGTDNPDGGIVWIMDSNNDELHAYSTLSLSTELWNSGPGSIAPVKFAVPTVANGQVFVGTQNSLQCFGITGPGTPAQAPSAPANVSAQALSGSAIELNWTDSTVSPNFATNYAIQMSTDGVNFTTVANAGPELNKLHGDRPATEHDVLFPDRRQQFGRFLPALQRCERRHDQPIWPDADGSPGPWRHAGQRFGSLPDLDQHGLQRDRFHPHAGDGPLVHPERHHRGTRLRALLLHRWGRRPEPRQHLLLQVASDQLCGSIEYFEHGLREHPQCAAGTDRRDGCSQRRSSCCDLDRQRWTIRAGLPDLPIC